MKLERKPTERILTLLNVAVVGILCGCAHYPITKADDRFYDLSLPRMPLAEGERIESVEIVASCTRFVAINRIPNDWSVEVASPVAEVTTLKATAGHGVSSLWDSRDFDDFITMRIFRECFDIKVTIVVFIGEKRRTLSLAQSELILNKTPAVGRTSRRPAFP